jgi:hypothetical protein
VRRSLLVLALAGLACGPWGPQGILAGGPLLGSAEPALDARACADEVSTVAVETSSGWLSHSVTVLCIESGGRLYLPARRGGEKRWVRNALERRSVRLELDGRIFAGEASRVTDPAESAEVARRFVEKYIGLEAPDARWLVDPPAPGDDRFDVWLLRIDPQEPA